MKKELELNLQAEFPSFFRDLYGDPCHTCMHWGVAVGEGWHNLIHELCVAIKHSLKPGEDFKFDQIKEKFGLLRIYASGGNKEVYQLLGAAQDESANICEFCGSKEDITTEGSWVQTLCKICRSKPRE